ncbi:hypothetical protein JTE90_011878 [Oedothorax gibbosus]|uniref:Uncharacterized protein n=1 Tax=Oedothorax gibbosus TaxID=931172 RepID=A0AAV6V3W9_9ARAC|nr:hypothetical protein JTE90_011878 [Oedothorax gibbosus]
MDKVKQVILQIITTEPKFLTPFQLQRGRGVSQYPLTIPTPRKSIYKRYRISHDIGRPLPNKASTPCVYFRGVPLQYRVRSLIVKTLSQKHKTNFSYLRFAVLKEGKGAVETTLGREIQEEESNLKIEATHSRANRVAAN